MRGGMSWVGWALASVVAAWPADAQRSGAIRITGRVLDGEARQPVPDAVVVVEGTSLTARSDSLGQYVLLGVPPGPQVLLARRLGYAPGRVPVTVGRSPLVIDVIVARSALRIGEVRVTADAVGRAAGELGTASVINREAIATQTAASLAGVLELTPGVPLAPPGLDGVQQFSLRAVPAPTLASGASASDLASFGTLILIDGVPVSNNANLQATGAVAQLGAPTSAGGGVDLRRIPASTLERVEVIRGIPSARFGDLTQGAVVVETRAGAFTPELLGRYDPRTAEASFAGGRRWSDGRHVASFATDLARTRLAPGTNDDVAWRASLQFAHRGTLGAAVVGSAVDRRLTFDSRIDAYQLYQDSPERPDLVRGRRNWSRDNGIKLSERATWLGAGRRRLTVTGSLERTGQNSYAQRILVRGAAPFTSALVPGRDTGFYIGGEYLAAARTTGAPWLAYARVEGEQPAAWLGADHLLRAGVELRREWNTGAGYQFDIAAPPQATFTGVDGYARPRRYDDIPAMALSGWYVDERLRRATPLGNLDVQAGARLDVLHTGRAWFSGAQSAVGQPRLNAQLSPVSWLRMRAGAGRTTKSPSLAQRSPALRYYDLVNVNWFTNAPAERLAVLTTVVNDPTNRALGFARSDKAEAGIEVDLGRRGAALALTVFDDQLKGAPSDGDAAGSVLRERFALADSSTGTGRPPSYLEPAQRIDTVPILLGRLENNLFLRTRGAEVTLSLPPIPALRTRVELQGAWYATRLRRTGAEFIIESVGQFQLNERARIPFYDPSTRIGRRALLTWRIVHQQPAVGLVVTATVQQAIGEAQRDDGRSDSLAFAGYLTRAGEYVRVAPSARADAQYADLRRPRLDLLNSELTTPDGWVMNLQVSKSLPLDGRLSFYAFNALGLTGRYGELNAVNRLNPPMRFGMELSMPLAALRGRL